MMKPTNKNSDYHEEERLTCVLVLDSFNTQTNEIVSHTSLSLCLWPVDGRPLLDYTIHTLIRSGVQEIILLATSNSHEIRSYIMNSQWLRSYPKLLKLIPCKEARSLGDCLRDLEQENIISNHFLLLYGNGTLLTNVKLNDLFSIHKENVKKDKNCVMTLVYRQLDSNHLEHPSYTDDQHLYITRDVNTHRLYDYKKEYSGTYDIPLALLEKPGITIETLYCPLDCHLAVCSTDVLHLFKDNFDFLTINEFVKGVLRDEEIAGQTVYSHLYETGYFLSVHNLRLYMKATFDILRRWSHPLVPEIITSMHKQSLSSITNPASPQTRSDDPYLTFYNISYPVIYDKHNIYKQGDVQLDRLSHIQKDVFIGHKSQIASGVCLRSSLIGQNCTIGKNSRIENSILWNNVQIGENCVIKNSIICDNVLIRNNVQIDKECFICKGVIIGTDVHLEEHLTIIASNSSTSTNLNDEIEIDDEMQLPPENFKRSNSQQRRSSTRLSEKSFSDKSVASSIEETMTSNSDLVGADGLGKELIFTSTHDDDQTKTHGHMNEDDGDDENMDDQLNIFDAWGYRLKPIENIDVSYEGEPVDQGMKSHRTSYVGKKTGQTTGDPSSGQTTDTDTSDADSVSGESSSSEGRGEDEFQDEVLRTLERAYIQKLEIGNIIVELNMLKPTYAVSPTEMNQSITCAVFLLPFEGKNITNSESMNYWNILKLTLDQISSLILKNYIKAMNEQMTLLTELDSLCLEHIQPIGERIVNILNYLYEKDIIDEECIVQWYGDKQKKIQAGQLIVKETETVYYDKLKQFVQWLQDAESEDDEEED